MKPLMITMDDILKKLDFEKQADVKLSKNTKKWKEEILGVLYQTHPWIQSDNITVDIPHLDDEKSTGVGAVKVGDDLTIPVIIKNGNMKPLDLFINHGKVDLLSQDSIWETSINKDLGDAYNPGQGESPNASLWQKVIPPFVGRTVAASAGHMESTITKIFDETMLDVALQLNPFFKQAMCKVRKSRANKKDKKKDIVDNDKTACWMILEDSKDFEVGTPSPLCYVTLPGEKIACLTGTRVWDPSSKIVDHMLFGIEANSTAPRYFLQNNLNLMHEKIASSTAHEYRLSKSAGAIMSRIANRLEAFVVPYKDDQLMMVGPFTSMSNDGKIEKIATASGKVVDVMFNDEMKESFAIHDNLLILGAKTMRTELRSAIQPVSEKTAAEDTADITIYCQDGIRRSYLYNDMNFFDLNDLLNNMEKRAEFIGDIRSKVSKKLSSGKSVSLNVRDLSLHKKAMADRSADVSMESIYSLIKSALFLNKPISKEKAKLMAVVWPLDPKLAGTDESDVDESVSSILKLTDETDNTLGDYDEHIRPLEKAKDVSANLLLHTRLAGGMEEAPLKTALKSLNSVIRNLKQTKYMKETSSIIV